MSNYTYKPVEVWCVVVEVVAIISLIGIMLSASVECVRSDEAGKRWEVNLVGLEDANETPLFF